MNNISLLHASPTEITLKEFLEKTKLSYGQAAILLKQDVRTLHAKAKNDHKDFPHYAQWRSYLALVYKADKFSIPEYEDN